QLREIGSPSRIEWQAKEIPLNSARRSAFSAGILMYRRVGSRLEVLLAHPGGPYWRRKDHGAWSIPKGEADAGEDAAAAAVREFAEETGVALTARLEPLGEISQSGGIRVDAITAEVAIDRAATTSYSTEQSSH